VKSVKPRARKTASPPLVVLLPSTPVDPICLFGVTPGYRPLHEGFFLSSIEFRVTKTEFRVINPEVNLPLLCMGQK